jgi:hypothetical protein
MKGHASVIIIVRLVREAYDCRENAIIIQPKAERLLRSKAVCRQRAGTVTICLDMTGHQLKNKPAPTMKYCLRAVSKRSRY